MASAIWVSRGGEGVREGGGGGSKRRGGRGGVCSKSTGRSDV